jgi:shikimate 5-dehydrogenase
LSLEGASICFLGCGGVSSAVATTVANQCKNIALMDINEAKAGKLKVRLSEGGTPDMVRLLDPEDRDFSGFDVIFNGTGLGKDSGPGSDLSLSPLRDSDILPTTGIAIDAVYTPAQTSFLLQCEKSGLRTMNGLGQMLGNTFLHLQRATDLQISFEQIKEAHSELFQAAAD